MSNQVSEVTSHASSTVVGELGILHQVTQKLGEVERAIAKEREWNHSGWAPAWQSVTDSRVAELKQILEHPSPHPWPSRDTQPTIGLQQHIDTIEDVAQDVLAQGFEAGVRAAEMQHVGVAHGGSFVDGVREGLRIAADVLRAAQQRRGEDRDVGKGVAAGVRSAQLGVAP